MRYYLAEGVKAMFSKFRHPKLPPICLASLGFLFYTSACETYLAVISVKLISFRYIFAEIVPFLGMLGRKQTKVRVKGGGYARDCEESRGSFYLGSQRWLTVE